MNRNLISLLCLCIFCVSCNCASDIVDPPKPPADLIELVQQMSSQWIDFRMDSAVWVHFNSFDAGWQTATTLAELQVFVATYGDSDLWDTSVLVAQIKGSAKYKASPIADYAVLDGIKDAWEHYVYVE